MVIGNFQEALKAQSWLRRFIQKTEQINSKCKQQILNVKSLITNCVCLNDTTRTKFELMAKDVFRKYMALYPEDEIVEIRNHDRTSIISPSRLYIFIWLIISIIMILCY